MKKLLSIIITTLAVTFATQAKDITKTLKNGKVYKFDSKEYAIVKRKQKKKQKTITRVIVRTVTTQRKRNKNRIYGLLGRGHTGKLQTRSDGLNFLTTQDRGAVFGIGYQRELSERFNIGIQIQDNKTSSFSLGVDF